MTIVKQIVPFLLISSLGFSGTLKISPDSLKLYDEGVAQSETAACKQAKDVKAWLASEIKNISEINSVSGDTTKVFWEHDLKFLKISGEVKEARWERGSPGTFGKINGEKLHFSNSNDGEVLKAPITASGNDIEGKIWLVEQDSANPNIQALTLEAKTHKALGLVVFSKKDFPGASDSGFALPVLRVSETVAKEIVAKLSKGEVIGEISLKTEYPVTAKESFVSVKLGERKVLLALLADLKDCEATGVLLSVLAWQKKSKEPVQGTVFGFLMGESSEGLGNIGSSIRIEKDKFDSNKFLKNWLKSDQDLAELIEGKKVIKQALSESGQFQGLIDKSIVTQYKAQLKQLESVVKSRADVAFELKQIYGSQDLCDLANDLKTLKLVHNLIQRGQWNKALVEFRKMRKMNPYIWLEFQKGKTYVDSIIEVVEVEIDRLDKQLDDNFFKVYKSIENLAKI